MAALVCSQCGALPERRLDPRSDMRVYSCTGCKHRGEATTSEPRARGSWNLINDPEFPRHTCKAAPLPRFRQVDGKWGAYCSCGFNDAGYHSIEGARAGWVRALR